MLLTLPDGTDLRIRPIVPEDKPLLIEGLRRLSPESAFRRFLSPKVNFSAAELRYLTEVDGVDHIALVALLADDPQRLVAVARLVRTDAETAELAITVGDPWQGRGIGRALVEMLAKEARARGVKRISGTMLAGNRPALRLMQGFGTHIDHDAMSHGVREVITRLAA
jgi:GNAT superfamily N-acetyltransferase